MQRIIIDEPYRFVPPHRGRIWPTLLHPILRLYLRRNHGVIRVECRGIEKLSHSLEGGHGILLAPNHCRPCDPLVLLAATRLARTHVHIIASWHLFKQGRFTSFLVRRMGAFSIYREGMDRASVNCAVDILERAERPLVVFPEGVISRTNDLLAPLMEGTAFIGRAAARKRARGSRPGKVVVHPVAVKYQFLGDLGPALERVLEEIEARLSWRPQRQLALVDRIAKVGRALLGLKEIEYLEEPQSGSTYERIARLIDHLLVPLEREWLGKEQDKDVVGRVKKLRTAILPEMVDGEISDEERDRRWRQLADLYLAQQLSFYPPDYIGPEAPGERLLETVERFEEDLTDRVRVHGSLRAIVQVGKPIEVSPGRDRGAEVDPLIEELEESLGAMLEGLGKEVNTPMGVVA